MISNTCDASGVGRILELIAEAEPAVGEACLPILEAALEDAHVDVVAAAVAALAKLSPARPDPNPNPRPNPTPTRP